MDGKKDNLLILCYRAPYPVRSGSEIRMYQFIEILSEQYAVTVLYLEEQEPDTDTDMTPFTGRCAQVEKFRVSRGRRYAQSLVSYLFRGEPMQTGYFYSGEMQHWIDAHITEYQKVLCMHIRTIRYMFPYLHVPELEIYLDGIDAITLNYSNSFRTSRGLRKLLYGMECRRMANYEKMAYSRVKKSVLISERDRDYITQTLGAECNPAVIYNYAIDYGYRRKTEKIPDTIVFMGKMNYAPNVDAMLYFTEHIYADVRQKYPGLQLWIIGGNAAPEIRRLAEKEGVKLWGFVENPSELLQQATLVIAPMISGSGLQNKIVQAMQLGCTVITTPVGADGLTCLTGEELVVAENDTQMREKLIHYLSSEAYEERKRMGEMARHYIETYYSFQTIRNKILDFFK